MFIYVVWIFLIWLLIKNIKKATINLIKIFLNWIWNNKIFKYPGDLVILLVGNFTNARKKEQIREKIIDVVTWNDGILKANLGDPNNVSNVVDDIYLSHRRFFQERLNILKI